MLVECRLSDIIWKHIISIFISKVIKYIKSLDGFNTYLLGMLKHSYKNTVIDDFCVLCIATATVLFKMITISYIVNFS